MCPIPTDFSRLAQELKLVTSERLDLLNWRVYPIFACLLDISSGFRRSIFWNQKYLLVFTYYVTKPELAGVVRTNTFSVSCYREVFQLLQETHLVLCPQGNCLQLQQLLDNTKTCAPFCYAIFRFRKFG